jgi:hypothetical protein
MNHKSERVPSLHVHVSSGMGWRTWHVHCSTCGWNAGGSGEQAEREAKEAAKTHRCSLEDGETSGPDS